MTDLAEQVAATLEAAADYIDEHGWCQDDLWDATTGRVCIVGALHRVSLPGTCDRYEAEKVLDTQVVSEHVVAWNDEPGREQWEVTELLRSTAKKVRHGDLELS